VQTKYLRAGEFAVAGRLSPKALRLYAEQGLLIPARVDPATGYRYYAPDQLPRARLIARLRGLGLPLGARRLSDTADCLLLAGYTDAADIAATQARLVGSMQHPMVTGNFPPAAAALRELAPTYDRLRAALA
jgi:MerR HTH family regulatory protein